MEIFKVNSQKLIVLLWGLMTLCVSNTVSAQSSKPEIHAGDLSEIYLSQDVSLHIVSPEPIKYVDLSSDYLVGDLPVSTVARVKVNATSQSYNDSISTPTQLPNDLGIITVVGQSFIAQYRVLLSQNQGGITLTDIQIQPEDMQPLQYEETPLSNKEIRAYAKQMLLHKTKKPIRKKKDFGISMSLNNVYVMDNYIFLDLTFENKTNLSYGIDQLAFSIEDKKVRKATNTQSIPLKPVYQYYYGKKFKKRLHNIYVFKKFSYPNGKVLNIHLAEDQISGRALELKMKYSDVLKADTF